MPQNLNDMRFCKNCQMNVYPTRPEFNIKIYGIFTIIILAILITLTSLFLSIFAELFLFIYFMWAFMILNPYLIYYLSQQKNNCPRCYQTTHEKNLEFRPFGEKPPKAYSIIAPRKENHQFYCPYCGISLDKKAKFCKICGKKLEIKW
ncbi:MAG: zinc ribbon domain-containing protein [Promethearchaeota archaeon]